MKSVHITVLASAVGMALFGVASTSAAPVTAEASAAQIIDVSPVGRYIVTFAEAGLVSYTGGVNGFARTAPDANLVQLHDARKFDINSASATAYKSYLASQRSLHVAAIEAALGRQLTVRFSYDVTRNAISAAMSPAEAAQVAQVAGVASVKPVLLKHPDTFRGPTFIGANTIWDGTGIPSYATQTRGQGVKVGVIDTGTNIGHPSFADDATCGFTAQIPKLHGRDCTANNGSVCTGNDPNAPDGDGHGVHTSSTAAGNTIDNTAVPAPLLPNGVTMSGVAPCASVYAYRVAEDDGSLTDEAITAAIQNAIVDQVDVVNFSIGPTCGGGNPWTDSLDFLAAEGADVFVAASAGNTRSTCTNPVGLVANNGPWMLTVAASTQDQALGQELVITGPGTPPVELDSIQLVAGSVTVPAETTPLTDFPLRTYPANLSGCNDTGGIPAHYFDGSIAVVRRGFQAPGTVACSFVEKITNATNAGAVMAVIANNQNQSTTMLADGTTIPAFLIPTLAVSDSLISFVSANQGTINPDVVFANGFDEATPIATADYNLSAIFPVTGDVLAGFSFRGPTQAPYDNLTKPDITGPGVNIYAAETPSEGSYGLLSGTSMSSPHLAGSAALVRAVQPSWSVMEVKSALMTTASLPGVEQDGTTPWTVDDVGNGRVDLSKATRAGLTLDESVANFNAANPTGGSINQKQLNLASVRDSNCGASCTWTRTFKNRLHASGSYTLSGVDPAGYHLTFAPATFTLAQDATQAVTITATATSTPTATLSFGRIDIHESANQSPDQHLSVAVKGGTTVPPSGFCTGGNCNLQIDTMTTSFSGLGCASYCGFLWMNRYTPDAGEFPITLNSITTIFGSGAGWNAAGDHINVYVYQDGDGDPTNGATLVGSYIGYTMPTPVNSFATITLPTPIVINGPGDVIIALTNPTGNTGSRPAAMDAGVGYVTNRSYISNGTYVDTVAGSPPDLGSATVDPVPMDAIGISKTLVIRGTGTNGGGRPITLSIEPNAK